MDPRLDVPAWGPHLSSKGAFGGFRDNLLLEAAGETAEDARHSFLWIIYIYICIHMYTCYILFLYTYMSINIYTYMYAYVYVYTYVCICEYILLDM